MATDRQIEANRKNSARSTGPKTEAGKARSRANATRHGLASESAVVESGFSPDFADRRTKWAGTRPPVDDVAGWALDRAVAASLRIERCERAVEDLCSADRQRATLAWDQDRAFEASAIFARLPKDPAVASRELQLTAAGVELLLEAWIVLIEALQGGVDWSKSERTQALNLLGVAADLRSGRTPVDAPDGHDPIAFRQALALEEFDRLEAHRVEALVPLDEQARLHAMAGDIALLSKPARLLLRYERDAWRRFRESIRESQSPPPEPASETLAPPPAPIEAPKAPEPTPAPNGPTFEKQRRALLAEAAPFRAEISERLVALARDDEPEWLDDLERRLESPMVPRTRVTERSRFGGVVIDRPATLSTSIPELAKEGMPGFTPIGTGS